MKFLVIAKQKKNVDTFEAVLGELLVLGHEVTLAIQQRDPERDGRLAERLRHERFTLVPCPDERTDAWRAAAPLVRTARDWAQYTRPAYKTASKLHRRAVERLFRELGASVSGEAPPLGAAAGTRLREALAFVERAIPPDALHEEFLERHRPDVVIVTPGLHFGSGQTDFIKAARRRGLPVWMLLFSWDNLSTKGALHEWPDLMFVWNERQRRGSMSSSRSSRACRARRSSHRSGSIQIAPRCSICARRDSSPPANWNSSAAGWPRCARRARRSIAAA
jgi:hypothetical protein